MPRLLIAPDPDHPGFFYAEELATGRRLVGLPTAKVDLRDWYGEFPMQASLSLSEDAPTMMVVEHPAPSTPDVARDRDPVCLEPGCLTPAPLYCSEHRYQMEGTSY